MKSSLEREVEFFVFNQFGKSIECPKLKTNYQMVTAFSIEPERLGPFGLAISKMEVEIKAGINPTDKAVYLILEYSYDHNDQVEMFEFRPIKKREAGHNGYRVTVKL